jgi:hypothetical protein
MWKIVLVCALSVISSRSNCQIEPASVRTLEDLNSLYILDTYWDGNETKRTYETDGFPSFLQIKDTMITLFTRSRDKKFAYESEVVEIEDIDGGISMLGERFFINPMRPKFELHYLDGERVNIHAYQPLGPLNIFFEGHVATPSERSSVEEFLNGQ